MARTHTRVLLEVAEGKEDTTLKTCIIRTYVREFPLSPAPLFLAFPATDLNFILNLFLVPEVDMGCHGGGVIHIRASKLIF